MSEIKQGRMNRFKMRELMWPFTFVTLPHQRFETDCMQEEDAVGFCTDLSLPFMWTACG
jgi:hypothetical protein